jgi:hypothetical protein
LNDVHLDSIRIIKPGAVGLAYPGYPKIHALKASQNTGFALTRREGALVLQADRFIAKLQVKMFDSKGLLVSSKEAHHANQVQLTNQAIGPGKYVIKVNDGNTIVTLPCDVSAE